MDEERLRAQTVRFRELVGDETFWFTVSQNVAVMERDKERFEELALKIQQYFACDRCGKCCSEMPIHLNEADIERLYRLDGEALFEKLDSTELDNFLKTPCPYLKEGFCTIYEQRPAACKLFPFVVIRPVPTLQLCPMGKRIFAKFKDLTRRYGKKELKVEWETAQPPELQDDAAKHIAVYVALPIPTLEKFLGYLRRDNERARDAPRV
ncbi:MAG: YkgJ family cysteine cluster protein [Candidatus Methanospirareceae archaeon]